MNKKASKSTKKSKENSGLKPYESSTEDVIKALRLLAKDIQSGDGVVNAAVEEAANRMQEMLELIDGAYDIVEIYGRDDSTQWRKNWMKKAVKCGAIPCPF